MAPVVLVAPIWSAYYYLWALGGVAVLLAVAAERVPRMVSVGSIAALVLLSSNARRLDEFAVNQSPWTWQSHVNRHYIARSVATVERFLADMKGARSALPERSTVFFANVPTMSGWQAGNGPLVRWAYRDTSLRSYYLNEFSRERAQRGPMFFFAVVGDSLCDRTGDPQMLSSLALSMMLAEHPHAALDAIEVALASEPLDRQFLTYWRGVLHLAVGNRGMADRDLRATGIKPDSTTPPGVAAGLDQTSGYEARLSYLTKMRARAGYSPWIHARLAATFLDGKQVVDGSIEAYAFRILSPNDPEAWRKWAAAQLAHQQWGPALASLKRYVVLANAARRSDPEARAVIASLEKVVHGSVAQKALRPGTAK
jgi:hypothetical protein